MKDKKQKGLVFALTRCSCPTCKGTFSRHTVLLYLTTFLCLAEFVVIGRVLFAG